MQRIGLIVAGLAIAGSTSGHSQTPAVQKPAFDVVSIKPSAPGARESMANPPGRFIANNVNLRQLIGFAYRLRNGSLEGGPSWIASDQWTIEAKFEGQADAETAETTALRLQSMLEGRFQLKLHNEKREVPVYALIIGKDGAKLTAAAPPPPPGQTTAAAPSSPPLGPQGELPNNFIPKPGAILAGPGVILASAITSDQIADLLRRQVGRPVLNKTNLKGFFNMRLQFASDNAATVPDNTNFPAGPSIFTAVQEQLGLKLEADKDWVDVLVVDNAQKPMEN